METRVPGFSVLLILVVALAGCGQTAQQETNEQKMTSRSCEEYENLEPTGEPVEITVSAKDSTVEVSRDTVRVRRGRTVTWESRQPFAVFVREGPEQGLPTEDGVYTRGQRGGQVDARVRSDAACGPYKYAVTVYADGEMLALDPDIWILPE